MQLIHRSRFLQYLLISFGILFGIIGVCTITPIVIIGLVLALLTFTVTSKTMEVSRCTIMDRFAKALNILTTGYLWKYTQIGDSFVFIKYYHQNGHEDIRVMKVSVADRDEYSLTLHYTGDNVMYDGSSIDITKEVDKDVFLNSVIQYWNRLDYISWNGKSIKISL